MNYTLTKIRTFMGREGQGLNATLCCDGKPVAFILDDANGGEVEFDFRNPEQNAKSYALCSAFARANEIAALTWAREWFATSPDAAASRAMWDELDAKYPPSDPRETTPDALGYRGLNAFVDHTVEAEVNRKRLDRIARNKTLFRIEGDPGDQWRTLTKPYSMAGVPEYLSKKYGSKLVAVYGVAKIGGAS